MADPTGKDDIKTQFVTREGVYRLLTLSSDYSRPNRVGYQTNQNNPQVRVSIISLPAAIQSNLLNQSQQQQQPSSTSSGSTLLNNNNSTDLLVQGTGGIGGISGGVSLCGNNNSNNSSNTGGDRICLNYGKEILFYTFRGVRKHSPDFSKPFDKKTYKGTSPSCHDYNTSLAVSDGAPLLIGFSTGPIQLIHPGKRDLCKVYNEERIIDKTKVTCIKWIPKSPNLFLASHSSGYLYLYNEELPCSQTTPTYQTYKMGDGYTILTCKSKSTRNPIYKWTFNSDNYSINEFCFSPCGTMLAIVSQDGFLRVFKYETMELLGVARSYFGGFLCVCWSPDGKYIVVGGEDDLVTVWSLLERRVVARGQGHRSWVSVVAFDPYTSFSKWDNTDFSDDENPINDNCFRTNYTNASGATVTGTGTNNKTTILTNHNNSNNSNDVDCESMPISSTSTGFSNRRQNSTSFRDSNLIPDTLGTSYRLGSVSQDTQLCLWDITEDVLRQSYEIRQRLSSHDPQQNTYNGATSDFSNNSSSDLHHQPFNEGKLFKPTTKDNVDLPTLTNKINTNKYATVNCTIGSGSGSGGGGGESVKNLVNDNNSKHLNSFNKVSNSIKSNVIVNCVSNTSSGGGGGGGDNTPSDGSKSTNSSKSTETIGSGGGLTAFNTLAQRLSNFNFGNSDGSKKSDNHHHHHHQHHHNHHSHHTTKKSFTFSKSTGNHTGFLHNSNIGSNLETNAAMGTVKNSKHSSVVPSYDPMKLIGTSVCPRIDECSILEPLICKKIAHERLTSLIFREDCFLTACQDGFIYAWARPGYSNNISQHMSSSPAAPPGGTVV